MGALKRGPKPSTFGSAQLDTAIAKANSMIARVPKKRTIEESFLMVQGYVIHNLILIRIYQFLTTILRKTLSLAQARMTEENV
jgi:hypothetical protein